jgi:hypothetical protein
VSAVEVAVVVEVAEASAAAINISGITGKIDQLHYNSCLLS